MWSIDSNDNEILENAFGGRFVVYSPSYPAEYKSFYIVLEDIPYDACVELAMYDWRVTGAPLIDNTSDWYPDVPLDISSAMEFCGEDAPDSIQFFLIYTNDIEVYKSINQ